MRDPAVCRRALPAVLLLFALLSPREAGASASAPSAVRGIVTAMAGEVLLPGVVLTLESADATAGAGATVTTLSDDRGRFRFAGLAPGAYRLTARLPGFVAAARDVAVEAGTEVEVNVDLQIEGVSETVVVVPTHPVEIGASLGSSGRIDFTRLQAMSAGNVAVENILPLVPGVIRGPSGLSVKGGRPTQSSVQVGSADLTDPSTGETDFRVPTDAIASVDVLPNPYAVEFGRFTSGLTLLEARKGGDTWRLSLASVHPRFRTARGKPWRVAGVEAFRPRLWFGGRLFGGRLSIAQSLHYRYTSTDLPSRPQSERIRSERLLSFTRLDASVAPGHLLTATIGVSPEKRRYATLGTFEPPEASASTRERRYDVAVSEEWAVRPATFLETLVHVKRHGMWITGQGALPMEIGPERRGGNYFNDQSREAWSVQWRETLSGILQGRAGIHYYKAGLDVASSAFDGTDVDRPVHVLRADGTLADRIAFEGGSPHRVRATDGAAFVQDRWQAAARLVVEAGVRVDRDGVTRSAAVSPRLGMKIDLLEGNRLTVNAGIGRFVERSPLTLGALGTFSTRVVTSFAPDGTPLGPPVRYAPRIGAFGLEVPRARTWHVESDVKLTPKLSLRTALLGRRGSREHVAVAEEADGIGWLSVDSRGRSSYREGVLAARYAEGSRLFASASYVRSTVRADTNAYSLFFGTIRDPVIRESVYARGDADVPHRLVAQVRSQVRAWRLASVLEWRSGLPYSPLDERQSWVGPPNARRLRTFVTVDVAVERQLRFGAWKPWVGVEVTNVLGRFNPQDIQRNVAAPDAGVSYNSEPRRGLIVLKF